MRNPDYLIELMDSPIKSGNDGIYSLVLPKLSFEKFLIRFFRGKVKEYERQ